jgi:hypothetical protein
MGISDLKDQYQAQLLKIFAALDNMDDTVDINKACRIKKTQSQTV